MHLQNVWETYREKGVVVLGFDSADAPAVAEEFLKSKGVTFPNVVDASKEAQRVAYDGYRSSAVPMNYIIGRDGAVIAAFTGYADGDGRGVEALDKALAEDPR